MTTHWQNVSVDWLLLRELFQTYFFFLLPRRGVKHNSQVESCHADVPQKLFRFDPDRSPIACLTSAHGTQRRERSTSVGSRRSLVFKAMAIRELHPC